MSSLGGNHLTISVEVEGDRVVLGVEGEVDFLTAPELGSALDTLTSQRDPALVVDLGRCQFMDSAGLQMIAGWAERVRDRGATLTVRSPSPTVRRLATIMGLIELIEPEQVGPLEVDTGADPRLAAEAVPDEIVRYLQSSVSSSRVVGSTHAVGSDAHATLDARHE